MRWGQKWLALRVRSRKAAPQLGLCPATKLSPAGIPAPSSRAATCGLRYVAMKTDPLIHSAGRPKKVPLMEVECPADNASPTSIPDPKLLVIRHAAIKDLISKIELILPDVAGASQDLSTLRGLFEEQLVDAAALRSKSVSSYMQVHTPRRSRQPQP